MATDKQGGALRGILGAIGAGLQAKAVDNGQSFGSAFWAYTSSFFAPNKQAFNVDGGRWGSNYQALTQPERAQEFAIAANAIAREIGQAKYVVEKLPANGDQDDPKIITDPNDRFLKLLEQPNPLHSWQSWIETAVLLLQTSGDLYILEDPMSLAGTPMALYLLRSDRTQPIRSNEDERRKNPLNLIHGYRHLAEDGLQYVFPPERVTHIKLPNMLTDYHGMGMVNLLAQTLEIDFRSMESNLNLFRMGGRLNLVIEGLDTNDPVKIKEWQDKIMSAHAGSENAHRPLILSGNAKVNAQASGNGPKEGDYQKTREDVSRATGGMMGVPPLKMGQMESINRASAVVEQQQFLTNAVWPNMRRLEPALTKFGRRFDPLYRFSFPKADVLDPEVMAVLIKNAAEAGAASPNDIRSKFLQWQVDKNPAMDKHYILGQQQAIEDGVKAPGALGPAGPAGPAAPPEPAKPGEPAPPVKKPPAPGPAPTSSGPTKLSPLPTLKKAVAPNLSGKTADADGRPFPKGTARQRRHLAAIRAARPKIEKAIAPVFERHIRAVVAKMAADLEKRGGPQGRSVSKTMRPGFVAGVRKAADNGSGSPATLQAEASVVYTDQLANAAADSSTIFSINMDDYADSTALADARAYLATRITGVDQAVKDQIANLITEGADLGLSPWQIANGTTPAWSEANGGVTFDGIKAAGEEIAQERAMLIARTETAHLQDLVNTAAYQRMGVTVCDVIGCEDFVVMPGETYGCNSQNVPIEELPINFHPNHDGAVVPRIEDDPELEDAA